LRLARCHGAQAALDALPVVAAELGVSDDLQHRLHAEYKQHAALVRAGGDGATRNDAEAKSDMIRQVRLGVLEHKRRAITELRDQRRIDDTVLMELQAAMDLEEARLLGPSGPD
jgi:monovalent cation/hydrogen antiporter